MAVKFDQQNQNMVSLILKNILTSIKEKPERFEQLI